MSNHTDSINSLWTEKNTVMHAHTLLKCGLNLLHLVMLMPLHIQLNFSWVLLSSFLHINLIELDSFQFCKDLVCQMPFFNIYASFSLLIHIQLFSFVHFKQFDLIIIWIILVHIKCGNFIKFMGINRFSYFIFSVFAAT